MTAAAEISREVAAETPQLPSGWRLVKLEDVVTPYNAFWGAERPFPGSTEAIVLGVGNITSEGNIKLDGAPKRYLARNETEGIALEGDLLVVKSSGSASNIRSGKTGLCPVELSGKIACSNFMIRLAVTRELAEPYLLWLILNSEIAKAFVRLIAGSTTYPNIKWSSYKDFSFPLPPRAEQKRIAGILKEQMAAVERARASAEAQLQAAEHLPAAYLRAVFANGESDSWPRKRIGDVAKVQSGYAFKSDWFSSDGIRLLRNANVFQGFIAWDDVARVPTERRSEFKPFELAAGDIVLSLDRPVVKGGLKVARVSERDLPSLLLQRVGRFQLREEICSDYLFAFLNTAHFIGKITGHDQSLGVPHVSPKQVESVEFPCPSPNDQRRIAAQLSSQMASAERLRQTLAEQLDAINKLPAALLRRAFKGEL